MVHKFTVLMLHLFFGTLASSKRLSYNRTIYRAQCKGASLTETRGCIPVMVLTKAYSMEY